MTSASPRNWELGSACRLLAVPVAVSAQQLLCQLPREATHGPLPDTQAGAAGERQGSVRRGASQSSPLLALMSTDPRFQLIPTSYIKSMSDPTARSLGFLACKGATTHFSYPPSGTGKRHNPREQHSLRMRPQGVRGLKRGAAHEGALQWELAPDNCTLILPLGFHRGCPVMRINAAAYCCCRHSCCCRIDNNNEY